jgi:hypothetical protein
MDSLSLVPLKLVVLPIVTVAAVPAPAQTKVANALPFFFAVMVVDPVAATEADP